MNVPTFALLGPVVPPTTQNQAAEFEAAVNVPGLTGVRFHILMADAAANDFSKIEYVLGIAPATALLHIGMNGMPGVPGQGYRTVTYGVSNYGQAPVPLCMPVIWDQAYIDAYIAAFANLVTWLTTAGLMPRVHGFNFCTISRDPDDGEFTTPSTNPAPHREDFSHIWTDPSIGYTDALVEGAMAEIFAGISALASGVPFAMPAITPNGQGLGFGFDPAAKFFNAVFDGMQAAAPAALLTPENLVVTPTSNGGWAVKKQKQTGRLALQLGTSPNTPTDIHGATANALRFKPDWLEMHPFQVLETLAYLASINFVPGLASQGGEGTF